MNEKEVAIVGAGKIGKGFAGAVFLDAGWTVKFYDCDPKVIHELGKGKYYVETHEETKTYEKAYTGYQEFLLDERHACVSSLSECNLWAMALYPKDFKEAVKYILPALKCRLKAKKCITIFIFTNKNYFVQNVKTMFERQLSGEERQCFIRQVEIKDVIIIRSTFSFSSYSRHLQTIQTMDSYVDSPKYVDVSEVPWLKTCSSVKTLKDIKLYAINSWHAAGAYAGKYCGCETYDEVMKNKFCSALIEAIKLKGGIMLQKEYDLESEEIEKVQILKNPKDPIEDTIERVACEPIRKLGKKDRLVYPALLCEKYGIENTEFAQAIALALLYRDDSDEQAIKIQNYINQNSISQAVEFFCAIRAADPLHEKICSWYQKFKRKKTGI